MTSARKIKKAIDRFRRTAKLSGFDYDDLSDDQVIEGLHRLTDTLGEMGTSSAYLAMGFEKVGKAWLDLQLAASEWGSRALSTRAASQSSEPRPPSGQPR